MTLNDIDTFTAPKCTPLAQLLPKLLVCISVVLLTHWLTSVRHFKLNISETSVPID